MIKHFVNILRSNLCIAVLLTIATFCIYLTTRIDGPTPYDYFTLLAESLLKGQLYLEQSQPWLNELVKDEQLDRWYVVYPPTPALMSIPFVLILGTEVDQTLVSIILGSINIGLVYLLMSKIYHSSKIGLISAVGWGFGTSHWFLATEGSSWYISHICAIFFLTLSLLISGIKNDSAYGYVHTSSYVRWFFAGLFLGLAYWARLPTILASIFLFMILLVPQKILDLKMWIQKLVENWRYLICFSVGLSIFVLINIGYNLLRFGTLSDVAYERINGVLDEPWYRYGIFHPYYFTENFIYFLTKTPLQHDQFPYVKPSIEGMSFFLTSVFFILLPFIKWQNRIAVFSLITAAIMLVPIFMHGGIGFTQFGFRYAMEAALLMLISWGSIFNRRFLTYFAICLVIIAIIVNYWGLYYIRELEIYGW